MQKSLILSFLLVLTLGISGYATTVKVSSRVRYAKVFLQGATLTSGATAKVPKGEHNVVVTGLPIGLDFNSVEIKVKGNVLVLGYKPSLAPPPAPTKGKLKKGPEQLIKELQDTIERLNIRKVEVQELRQELDLQIASGHTQHNYNRELKPVELTIFLEYIEKKLNTLRAKRLNYTQRERDLIKAIQFKDTYLAYLREGGDPISFGKTDTKPEPIDLTPDQQDSVDNITQNRDQLEIAVLAPEGADVVFEIKYNISTAYWVPAYDIKVEPSKGPVKIVYRAQVYQTTGLNWTNIGLTLSTNQPSSNRVVPNLEPYNINLFDQPMVQHTKSMRMSAPTMYNRSEQSAPMQEALKDNPLGTVADYTEATQTSISTEYEINLNYTIKSDNKGQRIEIKNLEAKARYEYACVPSKDPAGYLVGYLSGWENFSLLPAEARIYLDGSYVGLMNASFDSPDEELQLSLARDPTISVKRVNKGIKKRNPNILEGDNDKEYIWEITIRNNRTDAIEMIVKDQVPISGHEELKVKVQELTSGKLDPATGIVSWNLKFKPSETKKLTLKYTLTYPKKKILQE